MPCNECSAPASQTNVISTVAAAQFNQDQLVVASGIVECSELPAEGGFFLVFYDSVFQPPSAYTVDFATGEITIAGAVDGKTVIAIYIKA
jgi:hypothetical protein